MSKRSVKKVHKERRHAEITSAFFEHYTFLQRYLTRFFSDSQDIDDVTQEAFLRAYVAEQQKEIKQPKAYLFSTAKNIALTRLTAKSAQIVDYIEECGGSVAMPTSFAADDEVEAEECFGLYCEAVAALPEKCREVFLLRKVHGIPYKEIAERMSLSLSSVEKYMQSGVRACEDFVDRGEGRMPSSSIPAKRRPIPHQENDA